MAVEAADGLFTCLGAVVGRGGGGGGRGGREARPWWSREGRGGGQWIEIDMELIMSARVRSFCSSITFLTLPPSLPLLRRSLPRSLSTSGRN